MIVLEPIDDVQKHLEYTQKFAKENSKELALDIKRLHTTGIVENNSKLDFLVCLCKGIDIHRPLALAESIASSAIMDSYIETFQVKI